MRDDEGPLPEEGGGPFFVAGVWREHGGVLDTEPADMPWGARVFRLRDPDGFKLTISSVQAA